MNKYEENVYKNLFEYPTKKIVELELENEKLQQENQQLKKQKDDGIEYLKKWGEEPDADMYKRIKEYEEFKVLLRMLGEIDD